MSENTQAPETAPEKKTVTNHIRMAKADDKDMDVAFRMLNLVDAIGRGEIGGFHGGAAPGYVTEPRPDCAGAQHERQDASDEGQGHNQEIRS